jgi:hypothetical protein
MTVMCNNSVFLQLATGFFIILLVFTIMHSFYRVISDRKKKND